MAWHDVNCENLQKNCIFNMHAGLANTFLSCIIIILCDHTNTFYITITNVKKSKMESN